MRERENETRTQSQTIKNYKINFIPALLWFLDYADLLEISAWDFEDFINS